MIKPLLDRVLLEKVEEENVTSSGILISDKPKEKPSTGKVLAVGPGNVDEQGRPIEMSVSAGDIVIYKQYAGTTITEDEKDYIIVDMKDILAIVEEDN